MYVLGIDTSSIVATIALLSEKKLHAEYIVNNKKTHSEKMMEVLHKVLVDSGVNMEEIDVIAVSKGPGSFTGIRIGMAAAQGMAHALDKPILGINALDGLAYNMMGSKSLLCPVINAQRNEVYTSLYRWDDKSLNRLWEYRLLKVDKLLEDLGKLNTPVTLLGDGMPLFEKHLDNKQPLFENISFSHPAFSMPRGSSIAGKALWEYTQGKIENCFSVEPFYIRKSNAEEKWEERHGRKNG